MKMKVDNKRPSNRPARGRKLTPTCPPIDPAMEQMTIDHILPHLTCPYDIVGDPSDKYFSNAKPTLEATEESLAYISAERSDKNQLAEKTRARFVICDAEVTIKEEWLAKKCFIVLEHPKRWFAKIVTALFCSAPVYGIHPSAVIHPEAKIHKNTYIGPLSYIGRCEIDEGTVIHGQCYIFDQANVRIGKHVTIFPGCVIGSPGFGFIPDENGALFNFPHIGGVVIEDHVVIQALTNVDRGSLGDTIIRAGAKVDTLVHVGHNSTIGSESLIAAKAMLGGSCQIGDRCWIGPSTSIRDGGVHINDGAFVGMGSLVVKDVEANARVMGAPAKNIDAYKRLLKVFRTLIDEHNP